MDDPQNSVVQATIDKTATEVTIVDIRMRFWSMVWFMVKWVIAAVPAALIILAIAAIVSIFVL